MAPMFVVPVDNRHGLTCIRRLIHQGTTPVTWGQVTPSDLERRSWQAHRHFAPQPLGNNFAGQLESTCTWASNRQGIRIVAGIARTARSASITAVVVAAVGTDSVGSCAEL